MFRRNLLRRQQQQNRFGNTNNRQHQQHQNNRNNNQSQQQQSPSNSAHKFGNLLRNEAEQQHSAQQTTTTTTKILNNNNNNNRPFVRDIRSLRNRVKLEEFMNKQKFIFSAATAASTSVSSPSFDYPMLRAPFDDNNYNNNINTKQNNNNNNSGSSGSVTSLINETLATLTDRSGYVLLDETLFRALKLNAESGDIVTSCEIFRRIVEENRRDTLCQGGQEETGSDFSSSSSLAFTEAMYALNRLLESALSEIGSTARPLHEDIMKFAVWNTNRGSNNDKNGNIFQKIVDESESRLGGNVFLNLRAAAMTQSIPVDSTSAVVSDFFSSAFTSHTNGGKSSSSPSSVSSAAGVFSSSVSTSGNVYPGVNSAADLSSLLLSSNNDDIHGNHSSSTSSRTTALHHSSHIANSPFYTSLRPYIQQIIERLFSWFFLPELSSNSSAQQQQQHQHPVFISLFSVCLRLDSVLDLFITSSSSSSKSLSSLHITNVFKIAQKIISSSTPDSMKSLSTELVSQFDLSLFLILQNVFWFENIMMGGDELSSQIQPILASMFSGRRDWLPTFLELTQLMVTIDSEKHQEQNDSSLSPSLSPKQKSILHGMKLFEQYHQYQRQQQQQQQQQQLESDDVIMNDIVSKRMNEITSRSPQQNDAEELNALLLLAVLSPSSSLSQIQELVYKSLFVLNKLKEGVNSDDEAATTTDTSTAVSFCFDVLRESFLKQKQYLSFRANAFQIEDVNSALINETRTLRELRIRLAATEMMVEVLKCFSAQQQKQQQNFASSTAADSMTRQKFIALLAVLEPHAVDVEKIESLRLEIDALEKRSRDRRIQIFGEEQDAAQETDEDKNRADVDGQNDQDFSSSSNGGDENDDDLFGTTTSTTQKVKKTSKQAKGQSNHEEEDEFEKLLAATSANKDFKNSKQNSTTSSATATNNSSKDDEITDDDLEKIDISHASLRVLMQQRRMTKQLSHLPEILLFDNEQGRKSVVAYELNTSTLFSSVFHAARETGNVELANRLSEERQNLYDPVKLL